MKMNGRLWRPVRNGTYASVRGRGGASGRERGAALIMVIGVVAALAVSAATLVVFTGNVQHNTYDTRMQTKSFAVCEAGLDAGMALLGQKWPVSATSVPTFDTAGFRARFSTSEFPNPPKGQFISVSWYDNASPANTATNWDANGDGKLWMVSQANVGPEATRVITLVERTWFTMGLPRGIPLWAGGNLLSNGQGNNPKIRVEVAPPAGTVTTVQVGGTIEQTSVTAPGIAQVTGSSISPLDQVFPQSLVDALTATAQANGRYFTSESAAESSPADPVWSPQGGLSGLTVIMTSPGQDVIVGGNTQLNSESQPGVLMILGGGTLDWRGTADFYGVIYVAGPMDTSRGSANIHGMVITATDEALKGTPNVLYNDNCIANLDTRFPSVVRRVPNSWREVQPTPAP